MPAGHCSWLVCCAVLACVCEGSPIVPPSNPFRIENNNDSSVPTFHTSAQVLEATGSDFADPALTNGSDTSGVAKLSAAYSAGGGSPYSLDIKSVVDDDTLPVLPEAGLSTTIVIKRAEAGDFAFFLDDKMWKRQDSFWYTEPEDLCGKNANKAMRLDKEKSVTFVPGAGGQFRLCFRKSWDNRWHDYEDVQLHVDWAPWAYVLDKQAVQLKERKWEYNWKTREYQLSKAECDCHYGQEQELTLVWLGRAAKNPSRRAIREMLFSEKVLGRKVTEVLIHIEGDETVIPKEVLPSSLIVVELNTKAEVDRVNSYFAHLPGDDKEVLGILQFGNRLPKGKKTPPYNASIWEQGGGKGLKELFPLEDHVYNRSKWIYNFYVHGSKQLNPDWGKKVHWLPFGPGEMARPTYFTTTYFKYWTCSYVSMANGGDPHLSMSGESLYKDREDMAYYMAKGSGQKWQDSCKVEIWTQFYGKWYAEYINEYQKHLTQSIFALVPCAQGPGSTRLYDAMVSRAIPVFTRRCYQTSFLDVVKEVAGEKYLDSFVVIDNWSQAYGAMASWIQKGDAFLQQRSDLQPVIWDLLLKNATSAIKHDVLKTFNEMMYKMTDKKIYLEAGPKPAENKDCAQKCG